MSPNQLRDAIRHQPFRPILITVEDGRRLVVEHPEFIAISPTGRELTFYAADGTQHWLDARLVRELVIPPPAEDQPAPSKADEEADS